MIAMFKSLVKVFAALMLGMFSTHVTAASFNCKQARSKIDIMICTDRGLSKLDEQLSAAYGHIRKLPRDEKNEKAMQLTWLSTRNTCTDSNCLRGAYEARIAELNARAASPIAGIWLKSLPCFRVSAVPSGICNQEEQDGFYLVIRVKGDRLCAVHSVSVHAGGHYDEASDLRPSMMGKVNGNVANLRFESSFGGTGTAALRVGENVLQWGVTTQDGGESWIPHKAELHRIPAGLSDQMPACAS